MSDFILDRDFDAARDFLEHLVSDPAFRPSSIFDATVRGTNWFVFRGQSNCRWPLLPVAHRETHGLENFTPQAPGSAQVPLDERDARRRLGFHLHAELRASHLFLESADRLGLETPIDYTSVSEQYGLVHAALNAKEYDYSEDFPKEIFLAGLALAQHHGVPTRLLDWTESPLVAAFFAAYGASSFHGPSSSEKIAVFALHLMHLKTDSAVRIVQAPRHSNENLRVQRGLFAFVPKANSYFLEHHTWPSLDEALHEAGFSRGILRRYTLPSSQADELLRLLYPLGLTRHSLMPSLDNAATAFQYARTLFPK